VPNTLAQLNTFSNQSYTFQDERPYSITFSANATTNQNVTTSEDSPFTSPVGINITSVISQPFDGSTLFGNITYNINTSNVGNAILTWPSLPESVASSEPSTGVYRVSGIMDNVVWDQIKNPTIIVKDRATNFSYTANIVYPDMDGSTISEWNWTNNVIVSNTHSELSNATNFTYDEDVPKTIPGTPTITDVYSGPLPHTLVITPNIANAVFSLSMAGNTSLDPVTKALTIVDSKANINTGLGNLWLIPGPDVNLNYSINYSLTNPISNLNTQVSQLANIGNTQTDFTMTTAYNYAEDISTRLVFAVDDGDTTATSFTIAVDQTLGTNGTFFVNGTNAGVGNVGSFTGNRTAFNAANVSFVPYPDTTDTVNITANIYKINGVGNVTVASNIVSTLTCTSTNGTYTIPTTFIENTLTNNIFTIVDTDPNAVSYTANIGPASNQNWYVNGNILQANTSGVWTPGLGGYGYTITGNAATINAANIRFMPPVDQTSAVSDVFLYANLGLNLTKASSIFGNVVQASNVHFGLTVANTFPAIGNMIARTFVGNTSNNQLFSSSTPFINDGPNYGQTYAITLTSPGGNIGNSVANAVATYSSTGNITEINNQFANVIFVPVRGQGNTTFTYTQVKTMPSGYPWNSQSVNQVNTTLDLTRTSVANLANVISFTANSTWTPTYDQKTYGSANILLVGGGGSSGYDSGDGGGGGGGSGGTNTWVIDPAQDGTFIANSYAVIVGSGGVYQFDPFGNAPVSGSNTSIATGNVVLATATGGRVGFATVQIGNVTTGGRGGNSGSPTYGGLQSANNAGGLGGSDSGPAFWAAGGGGGGNVGAFGGPGANTGVGGSGGIGNASSITGTTVYYAGGGAGGGQTATGTPGLGHDQPGGGGGGNGQDGILIIRIS